MPDLSNPFELISRYFWALGLVFSAINHQMAVGRAHDLPDPAQADEALHYLRRFSLAGALPWLLMGIGQLSGHTPTVWHYFRPQDGNLFVLAWCALIAASAGLFAWWTFFADGARKAVELQLAHVIGQTRGKPPTQTSIKLFAAFGVVFVPFWIFMASVMDAPLPP